MGETVWSLVVIIRILLRNAVEISGKQKNVVENWQGFVAYLSVDTCDCGLEKVAEEYSPRRQLRWRGLVDVRIEINLVADLRRQAEERKRFLETKRLRQRLYNHMLHSRLRCSIGQSCQWVSLTSSIGLTVSLEVIAMPSS